MRFVFPQQNSNAMEKVRSSSSTNSVLIIIVAILTFPIWIGILGGLFGLVVGGFGAVIGLIAGLFGLIIGAVGGIIGGIASIFDWTWNSGWDWNFGIWNGNFFVILLIVMAVALIIRPRK